MGSPRRNSTGTRIARLFRKVRGLEGVRECPLEEILGEDRAEVVETDLKDPGFLGALLKPPITPVPGIMLAPGQTEGQRRFSIAHELGHLHIPSHHKVVGGCDQIDMTGGSSGPVELEANDFAAELLMPRELFRDDIGEPPFGFEHLYGVCEDYRVSVTAAARRVVELGHEPCVLVGSCRQGIRWIHRSKTWERNSIRMPHWVGDPVSPLSLAAQHLGGENIGRDLEGVDPAAWMVSSPNGIAVLESIHPIPEHGTVLSLVWVIEP